MPGRSASSPNRSRRRSGARTPRRRRVLRKKRPLGPGRHQTGSGDPTRRGARRRAALQEPPPRGGQDSRGRWERQAALPAEPRHPDLAAHHHLRARPVAAEPPGHPVGQEPERGPEGRGVRAVPVEGGLVPGALGGGSSPEATTRPSAAPRRLVQEHPGSASEDRAQPPGGPGQIGHGRMPRPPGLGGPGPDPGDDRDLLLAERGQEALGHHGPDPARLAQRGGHLGLELVRPASPPSRRARWPPPPVRECAGPRPGPGPPRRPGRRGEIEVGLVDAGRLDPIREDSSTASTPSDSCITLGGSTGRASRSGQRRRASARDIPERTPNGRAG